ncbi:substrate-binding periplasmic protein [Kordiimonas sp.]|uniref:substrate-binding periplasmic protein n=1 Tax=Kordiimonas sp. TaxID=1970157 RepID=UPI003B525E92
MSHELGKRTGKGAKRLNYKKLFLASLLAIFTSAPSFATPVRLCNSTEFWPPYSFMKNDVMRGIHTQILDAAFADIGLDYELILLPWKRCQDRVAAGELDGIVGISYTEERGALFRFPSHEGEGDAITPLVPKQALSDVEFVVITHADTPAPVSISVATLPEPVGVLLGYRSAGTIAEAGKQAQIVAKQSSLFQMLERRRIASVVALRGAAIHYVSRSEQPLVIHEPALWSTPHFLAFGRNVELDNTSVNRIWQAIANVRGNKGLMAQLQAKVTTELAPCFNEQTTCD